MDAFIDVTLLSNIGLSAGIIVFVGVLWTVMSKFFKRQITADARKGQRATIIRTLFSAARLLVVLATALIILQVNGFNVGSAVAGLGVAGIVVGFALQDFLKDIIMGIHIITDRFYDVGDCVEYQGEEGIVVGFSIMTTKIETLAEKDIITLCNRNISEIKKISHLVDVDLPLSYDEDAQHVHAVLAKLCDKIDEIEGVERCEYKGTQDFKDSAIVYRIRFFCLPEHKMDLRRAVVSAIQTELDKADVHLPYNQLDVHCR